MTGSTMNTAPTVEVSTLIRRPPAVRDKWV